MISPQRAHPAAAKSAKCTHDSEGDACNVLFHAASEGPDCAASDSSYLTKEWFPIE